MTSERIEPNATSAVFHGTFRLTPEIHKRGEALLHAQPVPLMTRVAQVVEGTRVPSRRSVAALYLAAFVSLCYGISRFNDLLLVLAAVFGFNAVCFTALRWARVSARKTLFASLAASTDETSFRIDAEGLTISSVRARSTLFWVGIHTIVRGERDLLVYAPQVIHLPVEAFGDGERFAAAAAYMEDRARDAAGDVDGFARVP